MRKLSQIKFPVTAIFKLYTMILVADCSAIHLFISFCQFINQLLLKNRVFTKSSNDAVLALYAL